MNSRNLRGLCGILLTLCTAQAVAQSNAEGYLFGEVISDQQDSSLEIQVQSLDSGYHASLHPKTNGAYRFLSLPVGRYSVQLLQAGKLQREQQATVRVGQGTAVDFSLLSTIKVQQLDSIEVAGVSSSQLIDLSTTGISDYYSREKLDQLPVARNPMSVALLSAGTTPGDANLGGGQFGGTSVVFAGASAGENVQYVNGFNITGARDGFLGTTEVPYEMYQEFQVNTGGYSVEFGRSLGGVVNAVTRRGTDVFDSGVSVYWEPEQLQARGPTVVLADGSYLFDPRRDEISSLNANLHAGGALIKDRLYGYGLVDVRQTGQDYTDGGDTFTHRSADEPFYGAKLDWNIAGDHYLEYTFFSDRHDENRDRFDYDIDTTAIGAGRGRAVLESGGQIHILRYSTQLTDNLALSLLAGQATQNFNLVSASDDSCPYIIDATNNYVQVGCALQSFVAHDSDRRRAWRIDAQWVLADHYLRFGVDLEHNRSRSDERYPGDAFFLYSPVPEDRMVNGETVADGVDEYAYKSVYDADGTFESRNSAQYIEDNWQISQRLLLTLGLRNETFDNRNKLGQSFIRVDNQLAPRLGAAYDLRGDGDSKLFAAAGRYFLPVSPTFNITESGGSVAYDEYYEIAGRNDDGTAQLGNQIGDRITYLSGNVPEPATLVALDLKPAYQDEFILGYQQTLAPQWTGGVRGIYRILRQAIEDTAQASYELYQQYPDGVFPDYVLINPGREVSLLADINGDGQLQQVNLGTLGLPRAQRKYLAAEFVFERSQGSGPWSLQGSYTLAHSYGNFEGSANSLAGQRGGISYDFDYTHFADGSYGNLPNDHRHTVKLYGSYDVLPQLQVAANLLFVTGAPLSAVGVYPDPDDPAAYQGGASSFYSGGVLRPRGSLGHGPSTTQLDLALKYLPRLFGRELTLGVDVFNVFNARHVTSYNSQAEDGNGEPSIFFMTPQGFQQARSLRLSLVYNFN